MEIGDFKFYDIIIFAAIAVFLVFRLRKVLGRRTGFEKNNRDNLEHTRDHTRDKRKEKIIPELDDNFMELKKAYMAFDKFDHKQFLDGAKNAFEIIINAFNKGDNKILKNLLIDEVHSVFKEEINKKNNEPESQIYSLNIEKIEEVLIDQDKVIIKIKFISEHFKNNDEKTIVKKEDIWSFEKLIKSKNLNWLLSST